MKKFRSYHLAAACFAPLLLTLAIIGCSRTGQEGIEILNVSYDPTRELYEDFNAAFRTHWQEAHGESIRVAKSHGGSGKQARAVIDGLEADVVTLAVGFDVDAIASAGLLAADWRTRLPDNSAPYTSTIVFLVRQGNPKKIRDWDDLVRSDVQVITPNPQTSGGARWNYLAAWGFVLKKELGDLKKIHDPANAGRLAAAEKKAERFLGELFARVPALDSGARASTNTFVHRQLGDVLLAWENEALLTLKELGRDRFEMVVPSVSVLAEPPVAVVDKVVDKRGTRKLAEEYLRYLYSPAGQEIAARHYYRPRLSAVAEKYKDQFAKLELFTIDDVFGGWPKAQKTHFDRGGVYDRIQRP